PRSGGRDSIRETSQIDASNPVPLVLMGTAIKPHAKGQLMMMTTRKLLPLSSSLLLSWASTLAAATAVAQTPSVTPAATPAPAAEAPPPASAPAPAPAPAAEKPRAARAVSSPAAQ